MANNCWRLKKKLQGKSQSGKVVQAPRISALFWGAKKSAEPKEVEINLSLGEFTLTGSGTLKEVFLLLYTIPPFNRYGRLT